MTKVDTQNMHFLRAVQFFISDFSSFYSMDDQKCKTKPLSFYDSSFESLRRKNIGYFKATLKKIRKNIIHIF